MPQMHHVHSAYNNFMFMLVPPGCVEVIRGEDWKPGTVFTTCNGGIVVETLLHSTLASVAIEALASPPPDLRECVRAGEVGEEADLELTGPLTLVCFFGEEATEDVYVPTRPGRHRVRVIRHEPTPNVDPVTGELPNPREPEEHFTISIWLADESAPRVRVVGVAQM